MVTVTSHLNNNIIKWNITQGKIKSNDGEYKYHSLQQSPKYLKRSLMHTMLP